MTPACPKPKAKKKKKRKKSTPRTVIMNKLDKLSAAKCREQGYCTICEKTSSRLNAHHYKGRTYKGVRWYQPNLICLCVQCHTFNPFFSAHRTPEAFKKKMIDIKGQKWHDDIQEKATNHKSWKMADLEKLLESYLD